MNSLPTIPPFPPGQIVATPGALRLLDETSKSPLEFLSCHLRGDWGDLCKKLWIITEADRSVTTLLLPAEY